MKMENGEEVVVLGFWTSPYVMRVKIALEEKGINFLYKEENILGGKSNLLLQSNPIHKKVPVLIHKGKPICESLIILEYIDQVWNGNNNYFNIVPYERAKARFWIHFFDNTVNIISLFPSYVKVKICECRIKYADPFLMCVTYVRIKINATGRRMWASKGEDQEAAKQEFIKGFTLLEVELGDSQYFGGDAFGLLDIALIPFSCRFYTLEKFCKFSVEEICPKLNAWVKRCNQRESVRKSLANPHAVYEFVLEQKKKLGID